MKIQKIQWAGILIETEGCTIMIDPVYTSPNTSFFGPPIDEFFDLAHFKKPDVIAVTHLHSDHFDPQSIKSAFGTDIPLLVPKSGISHLIELGFSRVIGMEVGELFKEKQVEIYAVPAVDGLGDAQVSWVVKAEGKTFFHGGDTLWHGYWWGISNEYGPFDLVFLPINGAVVREEGMMDSDQPICMNPEQAAAAAKILRAKAICPIHYGSFHNPPSYISIENPIKLLTLDEGIKLVDLKNKQAISI